MGEAVTGVEHNTPIHEFTDSTPLLSDPVALRQKAASDGYLFFKSILPIDKIIELRKQILDILSREGWLDKSKLIMDGMADIDAVHRLSEDEINYNGVGVPNDVYLAIQKLESFHALAHEPILLRVYETLFGRRPVPHPRNIGRIMMPSTRLHVTPAHQDFLHIQGAEETWTCWAPLGECPRELGGLSILEGSHQAGLLGVTHNPGAGGLESILCELGYEWATVDYEPGDFVTFNSLTVHKALPNLLGDRVRLSCDFRYQPVDQPIEERSLLPHGPFTWDEIYEGWQREDLKYYWKNTKFTYSEWNEAIRWQKEKIC